MQASMPRIIDQVRSLQLPLGEYAVVGGGVLSAHGIRDHKDIDLLVTPVLYEELKRRGWREYQKKSGHMVLTHGDAEASPAMVCVGAYQPDIRDIIARADIIGGIAFSSLQDAVDFKRALGREKDLRDIELIMAHLAR